MLLRITQVTWNNIPNVYFLACRDVRLALADEARTAEKRPLRVVSEQTKGIYEFCAFRGNHISLQKTM